MAEKGGWGKGWWEQVGLSSSLGQATPGDTDGEMTQ